MKERHDSGKPTAFGFEGEVIILRDSFGEIVGVRLDPYWTDGNGPIPQHHEMEIVGRVRYIEDEDDGC